MLRLISSAVFRLMLIVGLLTLFGHAYAQTADGNNGINQANTLIRSYFSSATQLMYAISGIVGLVGAIRVFWLWNGGHREEMLKAASGWFGSMIFIAVVALIIQAFFGL